MLNIIGAVLLGLFALIGIYSTISIILNLFSKSDLFEALIMTGLIISILTLAYYIGSFIMLMI